MPGLLKIHNSKIIQQLLWLCYHICHSVFGVFASAFKTCKMQQLVAAVILSELFENNIHQDPKTAQVQARAVLCALTEGDADVMAELNALIKNKVISCLEHHHSIDVSLATLEELLLLTETCSLVDEFWGAKLRVVFRLLFASISWGLNTLPFLSI